MSFMTDLNARIESAEKEALRGSGQSDVLYEARIDSAYEAILDSAPAADREKVEEILRERGYDPEREVYVPGEGECSLTGIDEDCCPCGRHP